MKKILLIAGLLIGAFVGAIEVFYPKILWSGSDLVLFIPFIYPLLVLFFIITRNFLSSNFYSLFLILSFSLSFGFWGFISGFFVDTLKKKENRIKKVGVIIFLIIIFFFINIYIVSHTIPN
jgi:hypothetical protein